MKIFNISLSVVSVFIVFILIGITVYAAINLNFSVSSRIVFNSNVSYKVEANAFLLSEETYSTYDNWEDLIRKETATTLPFIQDFSETEPVLVSWIIPYNILKFSSSKKYIIYAFKIENYTESEITASVILPNIHSDPNFDKLIENTASSPLTLSPKGTENSSGLLYLVTKCIKTKNSLHLENNFEINLAQL